MKQTILILLAALFMASCVSTKKYNAAVTERKSATELLQDCESEKASISSQYQSMKAEMDKLKKDNTSCQQKLAKTQADISKLRKAVEDNAKKISKIKSELQSAFAGTEGVTIEERNGRLYVVMANRILYKSGKAEFDVAGLEAIQTISKVIKNNQGLNILVEGHTDNVPINNPKFKDNWDLSVARAVGVVRKLELYGVNPTRLTAAGRGEFSPVSDINVDDPKNRAKNRRTEFIISPPVSNLFKMLQEI